MARSEHLATRLFINGDDFGLSPGVNEAVERLHHRGRLTSASILANSPWSDPAFRFAREHPTLRVGLHVNLTTYGPVLAPEQVPSLVDAAGRFYPTSSFLIRLLSGRVNLEEVAAEVDAQAARCLEEGIRPVHIDSHMHLHALPALGQITAAAARRHGIEIMRNPDPLALILPPYGEATPLHQAVRTPVRELVHSALRRSGGAGAAPAERFKTADRVIYLRWCVVRGEDPIATLVRCLDRLRGGTVEIVAHPAVPDEHLADLSGYVSGRERELALLTGDAFTQLLAECWVQLG
jgi:predicted glycoside hydrolase/deacetylase ChbG (UPF0249 family)